VFLIKCCNCGRTVEWKTGSQVGRMEIEVSGSVVMCCCGHGIAENAGNDVLLEFNVPQCEVGDDE